MGELLASPDLVDVIGAVVVALGSGLLLGVAVRLTRG
jgi:hypothetical protein